MTEGEDIQPIEPQNSDPRIVLQWSDDGGYTWSTEMQASVGKIGEFMRRVMWRRLGRSRSRVFRVILIANVPVFMIAAHIQLEKGYA